MLARTDMVARPLSDFVSGSWTGRLDDAGEATLTFPNTEASIGVPWRQRFNAAGHLQFLEIYDNGLPDFCGVIDTVQVDQEQVQVHCSDGMFLLKKAYERDLTVVQAPRDVIERGTQVWVPVVADSFPAGSLNAQWTASTGTGATAQIGTSGGLNLHTTVAGNAAVIFTSPITVGTTGSWRAMVAAQNVALQTNGGLSLVVEEGAGVDDYTLLLFNGFARLDVAGVGTIGRLQLPNATSFSLMLESDGEWVWAFLNGQLVGVTRRQHTSTTALKMTIGLGGSGSGPTNATVVSALIETLQPFLQRGSDKGDYVLPGSASTYPSGGLHARYYSDSDLQLDANRLVKILAPNRAQAYAGSGTHEYQNQQDATINGQANPTPGAATSNWSATWFGAIYLKLSAGDYSFNISTPGGGNAAFRVYIGKTQFGQAVSDHWSWNVWSQNFTVSAASLAGTKPYGGSTAQLDGWYPIRIEYAVDGTALAAPSFELINSPTAYTDPGGTSIASGAQSTVVPATSLSPLGCVDQRYQGVSHFDLVQQTVQAFGYQASVEPQQLESSLFPGVLAPRLREGHDTDIVLKPDTGPRTDGEGILNYNSTADATDSAASLFGNGAGFANGTAGQLQGLVYDPPTLANALFDLQGWQDFSDASFQPLLNALLNTQLGLKLAPWQLLSADPQGSPRIAYTWPLPGVLAAMRWRPGDGLRIQALNINVNDTSPRQLLVITREITPDGRTNTTASFANRPLNEARILKQQLYAATRIQRNYQKQLVTLTGNYVSGSVAAGTDGGSSIVPLLATDQIVHARLRVTVAGAAFSIKVNNVDQTTTLTGAATVSTVPLNLDIMAVATSDANGRLYVALHNGTGGAASYEYALLVDVLR